MEDLRRRRVKAAWIDIGVVVLVFLPFGLLAGDVDTGPNEYGIYLEGPPVLFFICAVLAYFGLTEGATGQTLGKRSQEIQVVDLAGEAPGRGAIATRTLLRIVDWLPIFFLAGYLALRLSGERFQRLGDLVAKTTVMGAVERPGRPGPKVVLSLVAIGALSLAAAVATSDADAKESFIERADEICSRFEARTASAEGELNEARRPAEGVRALAELSQVAAESTAELQGLDPPAAFDEEWSE
jgi:uncharacterized RDD family membrane protein YckC